MKTLGVYRLASSHGMLGTAAKLEGEDIEARIQQFRRWREIVKKLPGIFCISRTYFRGSPEVVHFVLQMNEDGRWKTVEYQSEAFIPAP